MLPPVRSARASALAATLALSAAGAIAGAVRLLPWLLDPLVPWRVAAPFARGLVALALEAALVVGWPVGWALACCRAVESGAARVLATLGESPARTAARLAPEGLAIAVALAVVAAVSGADASAPGRVATELLAEARASCLKARAPTTYLVPFTGLSWLCAPDREPRLAGAVPEAIGGLGGGAMGRAGITARAARVAGDFRSIELEDARLALPGGARAQGGEPPEPAGPTEGGARAVGGIAVHVQTLSLRGMAPWAHASTLPAALRVGVFVLSAWGAAVIAAYGVLQRGVRARLAAIAIGAAGPLAALGLSRAFERQGARPAAFLFVPVAGCGCAAIAALVAPRVRGWWGVRLRSCWPRLAAALASRRSRC